MKEKIGLIRLIDYLAGWGEHLFQESGTTTLVIKKDIYTKAYGQYLYIKERLPALLDYMDKYSGLRVVEAGLQVKYPYNENSSYIGTSKLVFEVEIPGALVFPEACHEESAEGIGVLLKTMLKADIIKRLPEGFITFNIPFAKDSEEFLLFECPGGQNGWGEGEFGVLSATKKDIESSLQGLLSDFQAKLIAYLIPSHKQAGPLKVKIKFTEQAPVEKRAEIVRAVSTLLRDYHISSYPSFF